MGFWSVLGEIARVVVVPPGVHVVIAAKNYVSDKIEEGKSVARDEGKKAGEAVAAEKYEAKVKDLVNRLQSYHNFDEKVLGFYAVGLAISNADGHISDDELKEIEGFVTGCLSNSLPQHIKDTITSLRANPPSLERAIKFARDAEVPRQDIDDVISLVAMADDQISYCEQKFIDNWKAMSKSYAFV